MSRVVILTGDPIGVKMAGPAIRSWNMALHLSLENEVTLVTTTNLEEGTSAPFALAQVRPSDQAAFNALERWADVIVFQGHGMSQFEVLRTTDRIVVADIYDPMHLEMLEQGRELPPATWQLHVTKARDALNEQLALSDFFLCASERQRLFYLGHLASLGRINPATYENDPHLSRLIDVVPFGLSSQAPVHSRDVLRGVLPGITSSDKVLIWGGGLYSWFDPKTLIRAVASVAQRRNSVKLFFLGTRHPGVAQMGIVKESLDLARELGALDSSVFFNENWVDYTERHNYLLEAAAGVSTHMSHVETTFAFRTRILDYLWANLPMIVTEGDSFAELVEQEGLGIVVPAHDVAALEAAIEKVLFDDAFGNQVRENVSRVRENYYWERTLAPLIEFVRTASHAADYTGKRVDLAPTNTSRRKQHGFAHDVRMAWHHLVNAGPGAVVSRIRGRLSRSR
ncbi:MAG: glycosyltransferase family 4 protein [Microbacteriaceae bacterium]